MLMLQAGPIWIHLETPKEGLWDSCLGGSDLVTFNQVL